MSPGWEKVNTTRFDLLGGILMNFVNISRPLESGWVAWICSLDGQALGLGWYRASSHTYMPCLSCIELIEDSQHRRVTATARADEQMFAVFGGNSTILDAFLLSRRGYETCQAHVYKRSLSVSFIHFWIGNVTSRSNTKAVQDLRMPWCESLSTKGDSNWAAEESRSWHLEHRLCFNIYLVLENSQNSLILLYPVQLFNPKPCISSIEPGIIRGRQVAWRNLQM